MKQKTLQEAVLAARMQVQQRREALLSVTVYSQLAKNHPEYVPYEEIHIAIKEELKKIAKSLQDSANYFICPINLRSVMAECC